MAVHSIAIYRSIARLTLLRVSRLDREITIAPPNAIERTQILEHLSSRLSFDETVNLSTFAMGSSRCATRASGRSFDVAISMSRRSYC